MLSNLNQSSHLVVFCVKRGIMDSVISEQYVVSYIGGKMCANNRYCKNEEKTGYWIGICWIRNCLKELFTDFEYIVFCWLPYERNIFCKRSISIKQLWLEIIEKIGCSKSVQPSTVIYVYYIYSTDRRWANISSQLCSFDMDIL